jgi:hypothetical protein
MSHSFTNLSSPPVTAINASDEKVALRNQLLCPINEHTNFRDGKLHNYEIDVKI